MPGEGEGAAEGAQPVASGDEDADAQGRSLCAAHGLRYDFVLHNGCVICRRAEAPVPDSSPVRSVWTPTTLLMLAAVALLTLALVPDVGADLQAVLGFAHSLIGDEAPRVARSDDRHAATPNTAAALVPPTAAQPKSAEPRGNAVADAPDTACARAASGLDATSEDGTGVVGVLPRAAIQGNVAKIVQEIDMGGHIDERGS